MAETTHEYNDFELEVSRGSEFELDLTATRHAGGVSSALSLASGVLWLVGKRLRTDDDDASTNYFTLDSESGELTIVSPSGGTAYVSIPGTVTEDLTRDTHIPVHLFHVTSGGAKHTLQKGKIVVRV